MYEKVIHSDTDEIQNIINNKNKYGVVDNTNVKNLQTVTRYTECSVTL